MEKPYSAYQSLVASHPSSVNDSACAVQNMCEYDAANDNQPSAQPQTGYAHNVLDNAIITASIRLFAEQGLNSAEHALQNAERCFWANDSLGHKWWMAISYQLDSRLVALQQKCNGIHAAPAEDSPNMTNVVD